MRVAWRTVGAISVVRSETTPGAPGRAAAAKDLKGAGYALWMNPENLTDRQHAKLADIQRIDKPLYRAYLLEEQLRQICRLPADGSITLLDDWIAWPAPTATSTLKPTFTDPRERQETQY